MSDTANAITMPTWKPKAVPLPVKQRVPGPGDMVLAIIGSRNFSNVALFNDKIAEVVKKWGMPDMVVSGGARGADTLGERWGERVLGAECCLIYHVEWRPKGVYDSRAGLKRNRDIIAACTHVLAFPSHSGTGTQHSIELARRSGKPCHVHFID